MDLKVQILSLLVGVVLPLIVGLITKAETEGGKKAVILLALSAVSGFLSEALSSWGHFDWRVALFNWVGTFLVAVGMHFGLLKPTGLSDRAANSGIK